MSSGNIAVIGGGAAGMMAAIAAAKRSKGSGRVIIIEKNEKLGKKLFITGKGRCNVTNACETGELFGSITEHSKFLYSAVYGFDNSAVMNFFEEAGCKLKIERGQRVFPVSDHSSDIIKTLEHELKRFGVEILLNSEVKRVQLADLAENPEDDKTSKAKLKSKQDKKAAGVEYFDRHSKKTHVINAESVIVATGGISYELTGSTGDGYRFAQACGHNITELSPALVPFSVSEEWCYELQGLSLKNVQAVVEDGGRQIFSDFGEMLFTHYGVSGPLILSASSYFVHKGCKKAKLYIDLKPALTDEQLDRRILREFDSSKNKQFKNAITSLFPAKLIPVMPRLAGINPDKKVNEVTKEERERFVKAIKHMELTVTGVRGYDEAIITKGGVELKEINPSTMESKLVKGLYFAGEVLDLDALTGGFNLQIAWSTGHLAGESAAESARA